MKKEEKKVYKLVFVYKEINEKQLYPRLEFSNFEGPLINKEDIPKIEKVLAEIGLKMFYH